jgi:hypothetical protein
VNIINVSQCCKSGQYRRTHKQPMVHKRFAKAKFQVENELTNANEQKTDNGSLQSITFVT